MQQRFSPLLKSLSPTPTTDTVKPGHTNCLLLGRGDLSYRVTVKSRANLQSEAYVRVTLYNVWEVEVGQKGGCLCKRRRRTGGGGGAKMMGPLKLGMEVFEDLETILDNISRCLPWYIILALCLFNYVINYYSVDHSIADCIK